MPKNPAAVEMGKLGGKARAKSLNAAQRSAIARKAVLARWAKAKKEKVVKGVIVRD
jgi:hypothetical protein